MQKFLRFLHYFLRSSKKCCIFAVESPTSGFRGWEVSPLGKPTCLTKDPSHGFRHFIKKGVIRTLFLALRNLVNSILFQGIAAIDVLRICDSWRVYFRYTHAYAYSAWTSVLLVRNKRAIPEPRKAEQQPAVPLFLCT